MRICAVSFTHKLTAAMLAAVLTLALIPTDASAATEDPGESDTEAIASDSPNQPNDFADSSGEFQEVSVEQDAEGSPVAPMLASRLAGKPGNFINSDVALDGEPVIGSFTVDGLTFAVVDESHVELVGVAPGWQQVTSLQEGEGPGVAPMLASGPDGTESDTAALALPETVTYEGTAYTLASIAAYAFYLSGVTSVTLPLSVNDVDDRAFRSSDAANVTVAEGNPTYSSFDGALYDADQLSLLLIPEGKQGTVRIPKTAEIAEASVFSHCPLVNAISVDAGSAAFASENGLLYDSNLTTLLRVPAGAAEITIREGCTTIAAGALEACANLTTINAPATVTSISPDIFMAIPAANFLGSTLAGHYQISSTIALSLLDETLPRIDGSSIAISIPKGIDDTIWKNHGFREPVTATVAPPQASLQLSSVYAVPVFPSIPGAIGPEYRVYLVNAGGVLVTSAPAYYGQAYYWNLDGFSIGTFSKKGYTCTGLYTPDPNGRLVFELEVTATAENLYSYNDGVWWRHTGQIDKGHGVGEYAAQQDCWVSPRYQANKYTISFGVNGGTGSKPADVTATYDSTLPKINSNKPTKTGYAFQGWYDTNAATGGTMYYDANNTAVSGKKWDKADNTTLYARWAANSYAVEYRDRADSTTFSTDEGFVYDTTRKLAAKPTSGVTPGYTAVGWATSKGKSSADYGFEAKVKNLTTSGTKYLYLAETPHTYTVTFDSAGGSPASNISTAYDTEITLPTPIRQGYAFGGWKDEDTDTTYQAGKVKNLTTADKATVKLVAQWTPIISADVPQTVTARVDLLGIEEQVAATSYIESRCGEPLRVTEVGYARLSGATELFGDRASEVRLEAFANGAVTPTFTFALKGSGYLVDSAAFMAFNMAGYGARVPISYRFAIPDDLLPQLQETTTAICQVSYTVGLN